jgi:hypothetical protein
MAWWWIQCVFFGGEFLQLGEFFSENENKHKKLVIFSLMTS